MKHEQVENRMSSVLGDVWNSMALQPTRLNCEQHYYQAKLLTPEIPKCIYRCVANPKPKGRSAFQEYKRDSYGANGYGRKGENRQERETESPKSCQTRLTPPRGKLSSSTSVKKFPVLDDTVIESLRKEIETESKEAVCVLSLKKRIARFYYSSDVEQKMIETNIKPVRRRRGRPPKRKSEVLTKEMEDESAVKESVEKQNPVSTKNCHVKIPRTQTADNFSVSAASVEGRTLKGRSQSWSGEGLSLKRTIHQAGKYVYEDYEESEDDNVVDDDDEGGHHHHYHGHDDDDYDHPVSLKDEELALQLHLDLNAPRLRKRSRCISFMSTSGSEPRVL